MHILPWVKFIFQRREVPSLPPEKPLKSVVLKEHPLEERVESAVSLQERMDQMQSERIRSAIWATHDVEIVKAERDEAFQDLRVSHFIRSEPTLAKYLIKQSGAPYSPTVGDLETVITREWGTDYTYGSLTKDFGKIGDPYVGNMWLRRAIDLICNNLASMGVEFVDISKTMKGADGKPFHPPIDDPEHPVIKFFDYINEADSREDFLADIVRALYRRGNSHTLLSDDPDDPLIEWDESHIAEVKANPDRMLGMMKDQSLSLTVLIPDRVRPYFVLGQLKFWQYSPGIAAFQGRPYFRFWPDQVHFLRYKHPFIPWYGLSPVSAMAKEIMEDFYGHVYNIKNLQNGAMGKGAWVDTSGHDLTPQQLAEAQFAADQTFNTGVGDAGKTKVLKRSSLNWIRISETNKELEFISSLSWLRDAFLAGLGTPKVLFASADATFANLSEAKKILFTQTIMPLSRKIEIAFNSNFFDKFGIAVHMRFKTEEIPELQEDIGQRAMSYSTFVKASVPPKVAADLFGVKFPEEGWEGWDAPEAKPTPFGGGGGFPPSGQNEGDAQVERDKAIRKTITIMQIQAKVLEEKRICSDPFYREMEYKRFLHQTLAEEDKISNRCERYFLAKWNMVEAYLSDREIKSVRVKSINKEIVSPEEIAALIAYVKNLSWMNGELARELEPLIKTIFMNGMLRTADGIGAQIANVKLSHASAMFYIKRTKDLNHVPENVRDAIIAHLDQDVWTNETLVKDLKNRFTAISDKSVKTTARTEAGAAFNGGRLQGMKELKIEQKMWSTSKDIKVRPSHQIDGETVPVDSAFSNGLMFPGDQTAGPGEVCNCRCVLLSALE